MRGSIYYQTSQLVKMVFKEGALKVDRVNSNSNSYMCIASFNTMNSYRQIWNNFGIYVRETYGIRNMEKIRAEHLEDYLRNKLADGISKQYFQKISSALVKLELALECFDGQFGGKRKLEFKKQIQGIASHELLYKSGQYIKGRAYLEPEKIIEKIDNDTYKLAARISYESGTRYKGVHKIKIKQLKGMQFDEITNTKVGVIETKEKGGRVGDIFVSENTYNSLKIILLRDKKFEINYEKYAKFIRESCKLNGVNCYGSHGFRWNFAKKRLVEYQKYGYGYDESLARVSNSMKHNRTKITEHYIA